MVQKPNVLVLDEPTNHLDLEAIDALVESLRAFEGTVLFVSHDRAFVSALATRVLEVTPQGFRDFPGTYEEYLARCGDDHLDAEAVALKDKREKAATAPAVERPTLSWEEQKRRNNRKKQLPSQRDEVLAAIERAETRKATIAAQWCEAGFYDRTDKTQVAALEREEQALVEKITDLMGKWESIEAEIASLEAE
jgi:ATPase subunit of ABC transporter with duplicated ATPase domains